MRMASTSLSCFVDACIRQGGRPTRSTSTRPRPSRPSDTYHATLIFAHRVSGYVRKIGVHHGSFNPNIAEAEGADPGDDGATKDGKRKKGGKGDPPGKKPRTSGSPEHVVRNEFVLVTSGGPLCRFL